MKNTLLLTCAVMFGIVFYANSVFAGDEAGQKSPDTAGFDKFELVKTEAYRFIGRSVYIGAKGHAENAWSRDFHEAAWKNSGWVFKALDEMAEYATCETHDAVLFSWNRYDVKDELYGYTVGRFMKAGTPVPYGMDYIDIPASYVAKGMVKAENVDKLQGGKLVKFQNVMENELGKHDDFSFNYLTAEVYPKPGGNGNADVWIYEIGVQNKAGFDKFEIVMTEPYRFVGRSVYIGAKGHAGNEWGRTLQDAAWANSGWVFQTLDGLGEYATGETHDAVLFSWNRYDVKDELYGYTIGRFMKAGTPVPYGMDYIDIPASYIAKGMVKAENVDELKGGKLVKFQNVMENALRKQDDFAINYLTAEVYPKPGENGNPNMWIYEIGLQRN